MRREIALLSTLVLVLPTLAQTRTTPTPPPDPTGAVTGHVFCADTNQPARFAKVSIEAIPEPPPATKPSDTPPKTAAAPATKPAPRLTTVTETALDGSFTLSKVKPGNYYVLVEKSGYMKPREMFTAKEIADPAPAVRGLVEAVLPRVHVEPHQTEHAEVRLERGAAVSGTVLYDDGSPAAELSVQLLHKDPTGKWVSIVDREHVHLGGDETTNDRGYFRLPSLLPDEYIVKVVLDLSDTNFAREGEGEQESIYAYSNTRFSLPFFNGAGGSGVARQKDATVIKLRSGQEVTGIDLTIPVSKLRRVTGRVLAGADAHQVNAAEIAMLTSDDSKEMAKASISREDGLFHFDFVPDGDYTLKVTNVRDVTWDPVRPDPKNTDPFTQLKPQEKERTLVSYGNTETPLLLDGDRTGVLITVPRDAKSTRATTPE